MSWIARPDSHYPGWIGLGLSQASRHVAIMAEWRNAPVHVEKGVNPVCKHSQPSVAICLSDRCPLWKRRARVALKCIWTRVSWLCFCFHLQFQNNNNYMNMAEANGALLAGDVSILSFLHIKTSFWSFEVQLTHLTPILINTSTVEWMLFYLLISE